MALPISRRVAFLIALSVVATVAAGIAIERWTSIDTGKVILVPAGTAALLAVWMNARQVAESQEQRKATLRPVLVLEEMSVQFAPTFEVFIKNVGPGPALGVRALGRWEPLAETADRYQAISALHRMINAPNLEGFAGFDLQPIGPGDRLPIHLEMSSPIGSNKWAVAVHVRYRDVFDTQFDEWIDHWFEPRGVAPPWPQPGLPSYVRDEPGEGSGEPVGIAAREGEAAGARNTDGL